MCQRSRRFVVTADTSECPVAGMANDLRKLYGVQFHPEVEHTPFGRKMISNFLFDVCGVKGDWTMSSFAQRKIAEIKEAVGDKKFSVHCPAVLILPLRQY